MALDSRHLDDIAPSSSSVDRLRRKRLRPWESDKIPLDDAGGEKQSDTTPTQQRHNPSGSTANTEAVPKLLADTTPAQSGQPGPHSTPSARELTQSITDTTPAQIVDPFLEDPLQYPTQNPAANLSLTDTEVVNSGEKPPFKTDTTPTHSTHFKVELTDTTPTRECSQKPENPDAKPAQTPATDPGNTDTNQGLKGEIDTQTTDTTPTHRLTVVEASSSVLKNQNQHNTDTTPTLISSQLSDRHENQAGSSRHETDTSPTRKIEEKTLLADTTPTQIRGRSARADTTPTPHRTQRRHNADTETDTRSAQKTFATPLALKGQKLHLLEFLVSLSMRTGTRLLRPLSYDALAQQSRIPMGSIRTTLKRLRNEGYVEITDHSKGRGATIEVEVHEHVILAYGSGLNRWPSDATPDTTPTQQRHTARHNSDTQPDTMRSSSSSSIDPKKLTNTEMEARRELPAEWSNIDATPLGSLGFTRTHVVQVYESGKLTAQQLQDSIYAFDFDLRENAKTKAINGPPLNYFMGIVRRGNPYVPPKNYKSPEDAALERYLEMSKQRQEREGRALDAAFLEWNTNLTSQQKMQLVPPTGYASLGSNAHTTQLKEHFRENIWPEMRLKIFRGEA